MLAEKQGSLLQKMRFRLALRALPPRLLTKAGPAPFYPSTGRKAQGFKSRDTNSPTKKAKHGGPFCWRRSRDLFCKRCVFGLSPPRLLTKAGPAPFYPSTGRKAQGFKSRDTNSPTKKAKHGGPFCWRRSRDLVFAHWLLLLVLRTAQHRPWQKPGAAQAQHCCPCAAPFKSLLYICAKQ